MSHSLVITISRLRPLDLENMDFQWRPASYALITKQDDVLLSLWESSVGSFWTLPGGGIEFDEQPETACIREVWEETGYNVALTRFLSVSTHVIPSENRVHGQHLPLQILRLLYTADIVSGTLRPEVGGSSTDAAWIPISQLHNPDKTKGHRVSEWVEEALSMVTAPSTTQQES